MAAKREDKLAFIDESRCVGCTLCIEACPFDAIVGAQGQMHTVVADFCTGCDLCVPACPVDCISMRARTGGLWDEDRDVAARRRMRARKVRLRSLARYSGNSGPPGLASGPLESTAAKKAAIEAALKRARARRSERHSRAGKRS